MPRVYRAREARSFNLHGMCMLRHINLDELVIIHTHIVNRYAETYRGERTHAWRQPSLTDSLSYTE